MLGEYELFPKTCSEELPVVRIPSDSLSPSETGLELIFKDTDVKRTNSEDRRTSKKFPLCLELYSISIYNLIYTGETEFKTAKTPTKK